MPQDVVIGAIRSLFGSGSGAGSPAQQPEPKQEAPTHDKPKGATGSFEPSFMDQVTHYAKDLFVGGGNPLYHTPAQTGEFNQPLIDTGQFYKTAGKMLSSQFGGIGEPVAAGAMKSVNNFLRDASTPSNLATVGAVAGASAIPGAGPVIAGTAGVVFGGMMAANTWQESKEAFYSSGEDRWEHTGNAVISAAMAKGSIKAASSSFERAALSQTDLFKDVTKLADQTKQVFDPAHVSPAAEDASFIVREKNAKMRLFRSQLRAAYKKQSAELDKTGVITPEIKNAIDAINLALQERMDRLPDPAQKHINELEIPSNLNQIETGLARIYEADKIIANSKVMSTLEEHGLGKEANLKGEAFQVFDTQTGKPVRTFRDEAKASAFADKNDAYDYRPLDEVPSDWKRVPYPEFFYSESKKSPGNLKRAQSFYVPPDVYNLLKNAYAPGLDQARVVGPMYNLFKGLANTLNQVQLSLSFFHGAFATMDSMVSGTSLGVQKLLSGQVAGGIEKIGKGLTPWYPIETAVKGNRLKNAFLSGEMDSELDWLMKAGGAVEQDAHYWAGKFEPLRRKAVRAYREGSYGKSVGWGLAAIPELFAYPMMEKYIPAMKLGIFYDMAANDMPRLRAAGASDFEVRKALSSAWDSIDNRLGQVIYDNMFWPKALKQLGMFGIRSLGWNIGTFRELGGGIKDWAGFLNSPLDTAMRRQPALTNKMAYTMTMPVLAGLYGGTMHYVMSGKAPEKFDDFYFPQTASGNRVSLPSYMKDGVEFYNDPAQTAYNKIHPLVKMFTELATNSDFRNVHITEENLWQDIKDVDGQGVVKFFADAGYYVGKQLLPFGITNAVRTKEQGSTTGEAMSGFFGFPPAPQRVVGSRFETAAKKMISAGSPEGGRTQEQAARSTARLSIEDRIRDGSPNVGDAIRDGFNKGLLKPDDLKQILHEASTPVTMSLGTKLSLPDFVRAFNLGTDDEKRLLMPVLQKKIQSIPNMTLGQQQEAERMLKKLQMPRGPQPPPG